LTPEMLRKPAMVNEAFVSGLSKKRTKVTFRLK